MERIPVYQCDLTGNEKKYVDDCLESTWISCKGKYVKLFEERFAEYIGVRYATGCSNGTVALHLALETLGFNVGDEIIVPSFTYIASSNTIVQAGAKPIFVDSFPDTWQMDTEDIIRKITPKTKAIMAVHLYGQMCDMDKICKIAKEHGLFVIEDCAEAFGSKIGENYAGSYGDISAFSFFGNKTITTGEGGMVVTNNKLLYDKAVKLKTQGVSAYKQYWHDVPAYNYRMTNIAAAIGVAQLERADEFLAKKRVLADMYRDLLKEVPVVCHGEKEGTTHSYWMFSILTANEQERDSLRSFLDEKNIETRPLFFPVHTMEVYNHCHEKHPVCEDFSLRGINLPSWPGLQKEQVVYICNMIKEFYLNKRK